jgi:4-hydroxy-tetrahydrodipicolinate synthase
MCGSDDQAADYFAWGVRSWLAGTANVLPRHHVVIMNTANAGNHDEAHRQFAAILPWIQVMEAGSYNAKAKLGLAHLGIDCGPVRAPMRALPDDVAAELLAALDQALAAPYAKS